MYQKPATYSEHAGYRCLSSLQSRSSDLYLTHCGIQVCPPLHTWGPDTRKEYHMHFILNGEGHLEIRGKTHHLKRSQIFVLPPNVRAYYYADKENPWYYAWASFQGKRAAEFLKLAGFADSCIIRKTVIPAEQFSSIIHEMLLVNKLTLENELLRTGYLYQLIGLLIGSHEELTGNRDKKNQYTGDSYVDHALQYIHFNYNTQMRIQDMVDYLGINRSYLFYLFKERLNQSPKEYLIWYQMEKAKDLLLSTSYDIKEVAKRVGYSDSLAFSKIFRQSTGDSPTVYRIKSSDRRTT